MSGILQALLAGFGAVTDEYFKYVTMLLPGNGTNGAQNNTFLDSSSNNFTITRNGNTTQGAFTPYEQDGYWSNYFDGTGDYLSVADNTALTLTGDHTIEAFVYLTAYSANYSTVVARWQASGTQEEFLLWIGSTGTVEFYFRPFGAGTPLLSGGTVNRNSWTHIAVVRSGNDWALFVGGSRVATATNSGVYTDTTATLTIGSLRSTYTQYDLTGYISNVRLVKGTAVYAQSSTTLTVPTAPLTAITNTSLLTCQSNRFKDNSTNNFTVTPNGDISVQAFQPFPGATTWSASVLGGSGYFDGSGDYLTLPAGSSWLFTGDHCLEAWVYWTTSQASVIYATGNASSADQFGLFPGGEGIWWGQTAQTSAVVPTLNAWNHVCVTRQGTTIRRFLNGQLITTDTVSGNIGSNSATPYIGRRPSGGIDFIGNMGDLRIINGSVPTSYQTSSTTINAQIFTPPTAPLTTTSQGATSGDVKLLLSYTNAGVIDNAMMNDLETVGNAQISTTQSKFGGGSMYFDGTGDALTAPPTVNLAMGTGDFTIEMWVYGANSGGAVGGAYPRIFQLGAAQTVNTIECYNAAGTMYVEMLGTSLSFTASTLLNSTWNHFAVTRAGTSLRAFVNGTQVGSTTSSNNLTSPITNTSFIGASTASSGNFSGYIDDLRITKGYARYTANFTAPTAPFPLS